MPSTFGREDGAVLVAVERANGGELAPLIQVLWTLHSFTPPGSRPGPAGFAASATALIELGVVEYVDGQLGLTPEGRKLLRRSGMPNSSRHVTLVTEVLQEFDERDLEPGNSMAPTESDVRQALSDGERIEYTGGVGTPVIGEEFPIYGPSGLVTGSRWVPAVLPAGAGEPEERFARAGEPDEGLARAGEPGEPLAQAGEPWEAPDEAPEVAPSMAGPSRPILDRLFGRRRRGV